MRYILKYLYNPKYQSSNASDQLKENGVDVPRNIYNNVLSLSTLARDALETNNDLAMRLLLWPQGSRFEDKNDLERLADSLEIPR